MLSLFAALLARLWYLTALVGPDLATQSEHNRVREVQEQGPRGRIIDRDGRVLVNNRQSLVVTVDRAVLDESTDRSATVLGLARELTRHGLLTKVDDIERRLANPANDPFKPVPIAEDVGEELEVFLLERSREFPGVDVTRREIRDYPHGEVAAHVLGYVGAIDKEELDARRDKEKRYEGGDEIGKTGIERIYEDILRGYPGRRILEIDASNTEVATRSQVPTAEGSDVVLTLDLEIQRLAEAKLAEHLARARSVPVERVEGEELAPSRDAPAGAVVVLDPRSGDVVAMASHPTYDPASFVGGIAQDDFRRLNDPSSGFPLNNRAIQGQYPPASTFKLFTGIAGLDSGLITSDETIEDEGVYRLETCGGDKCQFRNAGGVSYGTIDLRIALQVSSDVYFYRIGEMFWNGQDIYGVDPIQQAARLFGLGTQTGVQLPFEQDGLISDPELKRQRHEDKPAVFPFGEWFTGDNVNLAIGQGDVAVTPLQLANAYATFANGGRLMAPNIVSKVVSPETGESEIEIQSRLVREIDLPAEIGQPLLDGLLRVPVDGTARRAFTGFPLGEFPVAGKTGTSQVGVQGGPDAVADTAIFVGFGPVPEPEYVVAAVMEEAGFGGDAAAPLVRDIFDALRLEGSAP